MQWQWWLYTQWRTAVMMCHCSLPDLRDEYSLPQNLRCTVQNATECYTLLRRTNCLVFAAVIVNDHTIWITCKGTAMINTACYITAEKCQTLSEDQRTIHTNVIAHLLSPNTAAAATTATSKG